MCECCTIASEQDEMGEEIAHWVSHVYTWFVVLVAFTCARKRLKWTRYWARALEAREGLHDREVVDPSCEIEHL